MSATNLAVVRRVFEDVLNRGDLAAIDELFAPEFVEHNPRPGQGPGRAGFELRTINLRTAFPDLHYAIEDEFAADDRVVARVTARGTHRGTLADIPATGRRFTMSGIVIFRLFEGKIVERWANYDNLTMLQQLGVVPQWGQGGS
jgi:steroid delta-isomerase-like uncharacterized protein